METGKRIKKMIQKRTAKQCYGKNNSLCSCWSCYRRYSKAGIVNHPMVRRICWAFPLNINNLTPTMVPGSENQMKLYLCEINLQMHVEVTQIGHRGRAIILFMSERSSSDLIAKVL